MPTLVLGGLLLLGMVTALWLYSLYVRNAAIIDSFWGIGFLALTAFYHQSGSGWLPRRWLLLALLAVWAIRLSAHIATRNHRQPEDARYAAWRTQYGQRWWWWSYVQVFLLQGSLIWLLALPFWAIEQAAAPARWTILDGLGLLLWGVGFAFEAIGDWQLARFKASRQQGRLPAGAILDRGLWHYTRHPNYFGESLLWWGYAVLALAVGAWWAIFAPALLTWLLLRVSGVTMLIAAPPSLPRLYRPHIPFFTWFPKKETPHE